MGKITWLPPEGLGKPGKDEEEKQVEVDYEDPREDPAARMREKVEKQKKYDEAIRRATFGEDAMDDDEEE